MAYLDGVQNFVPAFEGQRMALQAGEQLASGFARGMNFGLQKRQLSMQERQIQEEMRQQVEQNELLGKFKSYIEEGMPGSANGEVLGVDRAAHIMNRLVGAPGLFVDPRTRQPAEAAFSVASKVLTTKFEMDRLKNGAIEAQTEQSLVAQQLKKVDEISRVNPDAVAFMYVKDANGVRPVSDISNYSKVSELHKQFVGTQSTGKLVIERLNTEGGQPVDVLRNTEGVQYTVVGNQDQKQRAIVDQLDAKEKSALSLFYNKEAAKLEAEAADLERGTDRDKQDAAGLRAQAQTYRQKLSSFGEPAAPTATSPTPTVNFIFKDGKLVPAP